MENIFFNTCSKFTLSLRVLLFQKKEDFFDLFGVCVMQQNVSWLKILTTISSIILLSLIERRVSQKILSGPELEETRSSEIQNPSVSWPMAVVLYDESQLTPFHKEYREFSFKEHRVKIKQNWRDIGVAAVVWDAVSTLCYYYNKRLDPRWGSYQWGWSTVIGQTVLYYVPSFYSKHFCWSQVKENYLTEPLLTSSEYPVRCQWKWQTAGLYFIRWSFNFDMAFCS